MTGAACGDSRISGGEAQSIYFHGWAEKDSRCPERTTPGKETSSREANAPWWHAGLLSPSQGREQSPEGPNLSKSVFGPPQKHSTPDCKPMYSMPSMVPQYEAQILQQTHEGGEWITAGICHQGLGEAKLGHLRQTPPTSDLRKQSLRIYTMRPLRSATRETKNPEAHIGRYIMRGKGRPTT